VAGFRRRESKYLYSATLISCAKSRLSECGPKPECSHACASHLRGPYSTKSEDRQPKMSKIVLHDASLDGGDDEYSACG
jgi:hypothetical protein